jgi:hypothetical protein
MKVGLVSANFGGIDAPKPLPPLPPGLEAHYYTDRAVPADVARTWTSVNVGPEGINPRLRSKMYKCQVYRFAPGADVFAWADASFSFSDLSFLTREAALLGPDEGAFIPHPNRARVINEYHYVIGQLRAGNPYLCARYTVESFEREMAYLRRRGHRLERLRLWSGGLWLLRYGPKVVRFLDSWWKCVQDFAVMDQPAISPLLDEADVRVRALDLHLYRSPFYVHEAHA